MECRAAVLERVGAPLAITTVTLADPGPGEVLVRIGAAGLCHTDLEVIEGQLPYPLPMVLGHEVAGTTEAVGPGVDPARRGERVALSWNPFCGDCFHCRRDKPILCEGFSAAQPRGVQLDLTTRISRGSAPVWTMFFIAGFAEFAVIRADCAVALPKDMPFDRACLLGCAVMTGVGAATNIAAIEPGETVMVIGCGAVGLAAVQGARLRGAGRILAVEPDAAKRAMAQRVGATDTVDPTTQDPADAARAATAGRGADCVIEAAGNNAAFRAATESCRAGGQVIWLGKVGTQSDITLRWGALMGEKRITRSSYGGARPQRDFPALARAYLDGTLLLDEMITARIGLDDINDGFAALKSGHAIRTVVTFPSP
jgi:S-(hydroxymethyl)glutathione dehydrogenase/alcohol dehydrogenase